MKLDVINDLIAKLRPFVNEKDLDDIRMQIDLVLHPYDIVEAKRDLVVYKKDETEDAIQHFLAAKIAKGCAMRTINAYGTTLRFIFRKIQIPYNQVTAEDLRLYLARRINIDGITKVAADNERRILSSFYGWLKDNDIVLKSPMSRVERIKKSYRKKQAFSQMDVEKIRAACRNNRERMLIEVLLSTWVRASEIAQIRIDEIEDNQIVIHGKGDKERTVFLNPKAQLAIQRYLEERRDNNPYLLPASIAEYDHEKKIPKGIPHGEGKYAGPNWYLNPKLVSKGKHVNPEALNTIVGRIGKKAGVEHVHMHRFRRTGATLALTSGMDVVTVSKLLGHASIDTTQLYLDVSEIDLKSAHSKFVV